VVVGEQDRAAADLFAEVFARSYADCVRFAAGMFGDWSSADDAVQDAFVRLWARPPRLFDDRAATGYVFRTVLNMARMRQRRDRRRRDLEAATVCDAAADVDLGVDIRVALDLLPPRRRACVLSRYLLDLSERDTAAVLGISIGTVKSQTHKGLRQLRQHLGDEVGVRDE
jgi:RNA polymerase sigma factor (sigma-70 family)